MNDGPMRGFKRNSNGIYIFKNKVGEENKHNNNKQ